MQHYPRTRFLRRTSLASTYNPVPRDLYPSWRWNEKLSAIEEAKLKHGLKPDLPDFYNFIMERPKEDARGFGLLHVEVKQYLMTHVWCWLLGGKWEVARPGHVLCFSEVGVQEDSVVWRCPLWCRWRAFFEVRRFAWKHVLALLSERLLCLPCVARGIDQYGWGYSSADSVMLARFMCTYKSCLDISVESSRLKRDDHQYIGVGVQPSLGAVKVVGRQDHISAWKHVC